MTSLSTANRQQYAARAAFLAEAPATAEEIAVEEKIRSLAHELRSMMDFAEFDGKMDIAYAPAADGGRPARATVARRLQDLINIKSREIVLED